MVLFDSVVVNFGKFSCTESSGGLWAVEPSSIDKIPIIVLILHPFNCSTKKKKKRNKNCNCSIEKN